MSNIIDFIQTLTEEELRFISNLDYGCGAEKHFVVLKKVIFGQDGVGNYDQSWYPYEVIELGANWLQPGHEKEFTACTLLVIHNVMKGNDGSTDLDYKFESHAKDYDQLPEKYRSLVLAAYEQANI
ncbi:MAG: hypothetical protein AAF431_12435 [Pseudomonadota bacterium]